MRVASAVGCATASHPEGGSLTGSRRDARRALKVALTALGVGGGAWIASTLGRADWAAFASALAHVAALPLALAVVVSTAQVFAQLARFAVILPRSERAPLGDLLEITAVGQLLNYTAPLRAGDAYKVARLSSIEEPSKGRVVRLTAALVLERVADGLALLIVAASTLGSLRRALEGPASWVSANASRAALAVAIGAAAASLLAPWPRRIALRFARDTWETIASSRFAGCVVVALVTWVLDGGTLYWTARSVGCSIGLGQALASIFLLNIGIAIPLTIGNIGTFEASLGFALSRYGIAPERALVIATLEHGAKLAGLVLCVGILKLVPRGPRA